MMYTPWSLDENWPKFFDSEWVVMVGDEMFTNPSTEKTKLMLKSYIIKDFTTDTEKVGW